MLKASVFVKGNKKNYCSYIDTYLVHYGIYYSRKKFYDTGPRGLYYKTFYTYN
jgi:hypothetical protein